METNENKLVLDKNTAFKLYPNVPDYFKTVLEETFTKEFFSQVITDRIKTIQDVYDYHGVKESDFDHLSPWLKACNDLDLWVSCVNEGWTPDYSNTEEYKYEIVWTFVPGSGWRFGGSGYFYAVSAAGSRLAFKTKNLSEACGKNEDFVRIYNIFSPNKA